LGSIYLNAQPRVFKSQGRLKHLMGNKTHIFRNISLNCGKQKPEIFNILSLGIIVCLEGERAYLTLVIHGSECVKLILFIYFAGGLRVMSLTNHEIWVVIIKN
jgi:hypothetical protein